MNIQYLIISIFLFLIGFAGLFLPIIPDLILIWLGVLIYAIGTKFSEISVLQVISLGVLSLSTYLIDFLSTTIGAKRYGASKKSIVGALIGGIFGFFILPPLGFFVGFIIGIVLTETLVLKHKSKIAIKAAKGALLGFILSFLLKILIAGVIMGLFFYNILR